MLTKIDTANLPRPLEAKDNATFAAALSERSRVLRINRNIDCIPSLIEMAKAEMGEAGAKAATEIAEEMTYDDLAVVVSATSDDDAFFSLFAGRAQKRLGL